MTRYAFDIDGTLTRENIKKLANDLHEAGHYVIIITGGLARKPLTDAEMNQRIRDREAQLKKLGVKYTCLELCIGETTDQVAEKKADICMGFSPLLIFEDTPKYIDAIEKHSKTVGLLVGKTKRKPYY